MNSLVYVLCLINKYMLSCKIASDFRMDYLLVTRITMGKDVIISHNICSFVIASTICSYSSALLASSEFIDRIV